MLVKGKEPQFPRTDHTNKTAVSGILSSYIGCSSMSKLRGFFMNQGDYKKIDKNLHSWRLFETFPHP